MGDASNVESSKVQRDERGRLLKGSVCNPKGRPKKENALAETIQRMVDPAEIVTYVLGCLRGGSAYSNADKQWACEFLAKRGWVTPVTKVEVSSKFEVADDAPLTTQEREEALQLLADEQRAEMMGAAIDAVH